MAEESGIAPKPAPRRFPRPLFITLFGPLVGALAAFILFMLMNIGDPPPPDDLFKAVFSLFLITIVTGWFSGLPAAILAALIWHFAEPRLSGALRVPAAPLIGAVTSLATTLPIIQAIFSGTLNFNGYAVIGGIGALSMAVVALPGRRTA